MHNSNYVNAVMKRSGRQISYDAKLLALSVWIMDKMKDRCPRK